MVFAQQYDLTVVGRQCFDGRSQSLLKLFLFQKCVGSLAAVRDLAGHPVFIVEVAGLIEGLDPQRPLPLSLPNAVDAQVARYLVEPGEDLGIAPESVVMFEGAYERLLRE